MRLLLSVLALVLVLSPASACHFTGAFYAQPVVYQPLVIQPVTVAPILAPAVAAPVVAPAVTAPAVVAPVVTAPAVAAYAAPAIATYGHAAVVAPVVVRQRAFLAVHGGHAFTGIHGGFSRAVVVQRGIRVRSVVAAPAVRVRVRVR